MEDMFRLDNTEGFSQKELDTLNKEYQQQLNYWLIVNKEEIIKLFCEIVSPEPIREISDRILDDAEFYLSDKKGVDQI
jgi:hypothetical protein